MWLHRSQFKLTLQCCPPTLEPHWPGLLILWQSGPEAIPAYGLETDFEHEDDVRRYGGMWVYDAYGL